MNKRVWKKYDTQLKKLKKNPRYDGCENASIQIDNTWWVYSVVIYCKLQE